MSFKHSEESMVNLVAKNQSTFCTSYEALIPNCFTQHDNEADLFAIRKSGMCDEFEIKVTRADFFNDAKKIVHWRAYDYYPNGNTVDSLWDDEHKHLSYEQKKKLVAPWQKLKYDALQDGNMQANYFWYILKEGIVDLEEVPAWAGVVFIDDQGEFKRGRQPTRLHRKKLGYEERFKFLRKTCYRLWEYRLGTR